MGRRHPRSGLPGSAGGSSSSSSCEGARPGPASPPLARRHRPQRGAPAPCPHSPGSRLPRPAARQGALSLSSLLSLSPLSPPAASAGREGSLRMRMRKGSPQSTRRAREPRGYEGEVRGLCVCL